MKRNVLIFAMAVGVVFPALGLSQSQYDPNNTGLMPAVPHYTPVPTYSLPTIPSYTPPPPSYQVLMPSYRTQPPQRPPVDWRDYTRDFHMPEWKVREIERGNRAIERNYWANCAKYNRFCSNMLESLGQ